MKKLALILLSGLLLLTGCAAGGQTAAAPQTPDRYQQIDQERAKEMMALDDGHVIVDVRRLDEYESGHIPGAICIPNESIETEMPEELPNPEQILLVYCRSGRRSKEAAEKLFGMGYKNVYEFGGIIDWTGEVALGQTLALTVEANPSTGYSWAAAQEGELFDQDDDEHVEPHPRHSGWRGLHGAAAVGERGGRYSAGAVGHGRALLPPRSAAPSRAYSPARRRSSWPRLPAACPRADP